MTWRVDGSTAVNDEAGIRITRRGRNDLRYDAGHRYLDLTLESSYPEASVYTGEVHRWEPDGEPFTPEERRIVKRHLTEAFHAQGYSTVDFGLDPYPAKDAQ